MNIRRGHSVSTYTKFSEKVKFLTPQKRTRRCANLEVGNASFSEKFAYVLSESSPTTLYILTLLT